MAGLSRARRPRRVLGGRSRRRVLRRRAARGAPPPAPPRSFLAERGDATHMHHSVISKERRANPSSHQTLRATEKSTVGIRVANRSLRTVRLQSAKADFVR